MENINENTSSTVEICIALEDFTYGNNVKVSIPALHPLLDKDKIITVKNKINISNIMNKDKSYFSNISDNCVSTNYISVLIPKYMADDETSDSITGSKGQKFAISFIGGDLDQPIVLRRI